MGLVIEENSIQIWLEIAGKTNLISRSDRKILFRHQLIKEYFAASYCNQLINSRDFPPTEMVQEHLAEIWRLWFFDNQTILDKLLILLTNAQVDMTIKQDVAMALVFIGTEVTEPLMRELDFVNRKFSEHKASIDRLKLQIEYFASEIRKEEEEKSSPDLDKIINWEKEQKTTALAMEEMGKESGILNQIRTLIAEILGEIGDEKVLPELNNLINIASQNETQQKLTLAALIAVKKIASPDSRVLLHNLLKTTEEKDLRLEAIEALGEVGNETTIELFREIILQNTYRGEEEADKILEALQKIWEEKTVDYSKKILSEVGEPAIDTLIKLFTNRRERDMTIRIALSTLGEIGQATHIEHIENYYTDFEPKTRKVAKEAIGKIKDRIAN